MVASRVLTPEMENESREYIAQKLAMSELSPAKWVRAARLLENPGEISAQLAYYLALAHRTVREKGNEPEVARSLDIAVSRLPLNNVLPDTLRLLEAALGRGYLSLQKGESLPSNLRRKQQYRNDQEVQQAARSLWPLVRHAPSPSLCRKVASLLTLPIRTLKVAAVTVPLAGWGLHHLISNEIGREREAPVPDVLYLPLEAIAKDSANRKTTLLAAARELRQRFTNEENKIDLKKYWKTLRSLKSDDDPEVERIAARHHITGELFESHAAFAKYFGGWVINRNRQLDELFADLLDHDLQRRLDSGEASGLVLADLVYGQ